LLPDLIKEGRKILILTSRRNHIADILMKIEERQIATCGPYVGGMKESELEHTKQQRILVATYAMAEEGFDCQALDTLIMATPKKELEQCAGRILRKKKNDRKFIPLIIDIKDDFSNFARWFSQRNKHYKEKNYRLSFINIDGLSKQFTQLSIKEIPWSDNSSDDDNKNSNTKGKGKGKGKSTKTQSKITDFKVDTDEPKVSTAEIKAHADYETIKTYKQSFSVGLKEAYKLYLDDVAAGFV
jgi:superfamily II DNA or RNA helicase